MSDFNTFPMFVHYIPRFDTSLSGYYNYDGINYISTFPTEWVINHKQGTGPKECDTCKCYGYCNNVFLGYCGACAQFEYYGQRGRGFLHNLEENSNDFIDAFPSIFSTYASKYTIDKIGDSNISKENLYIKINLTQYYDTKYNINNIINNMVSVCVDDYDYDDIYDYDEIFIPKPKLIRENESSCLIDRNIQTSHNNTLMIDYIDELLKKETISNTLYNIITNIEQTIVV